LRFYNSTRGCELTSTHLATVDHARENLEIVKHIFRQSNGILQLRDNWQLCGRNHGWTFLNISKSTQDYLCIEPKGVGYVSEQGDNTCAVNGNGAGFSPRSLIFFHLAS